MLEHLELRNFQCHKRLVLELSNEVTTIVGPSDRGKSAVIRALLWLATNRPLGESFRRTGAGTVSVSVRIDGHTTRRVRGKGRNVYELDGRDFKALGADIPAGITTVLNLGPVNWQRQHDAPFWLSLTPGEAARALNEVVDLGLIDRVAAGLAARIREAQIRIKVTTELAESWEAKLAKLAWVEKADADLRKLEALEVEREQVRGQRQRLAELVETIRVAQKATKVRVPEKALKKLEALWQEREMVFTRQKVLTHLIQEIRETVQEQEAADRERTEAERQLATVKVCMTCGRPLPS